MLWAWTRFVSWEWNLPVVLVESRFLDAPVITLLHRLMLILLEFRVMELFPSEGAALCGSPAALTPATCEPKDEINVRGNISSRQSRLLQVKEPQ